jgi:hypothetical protein
MKVELVGESGIYLNSGDTKAFVEVLKTKQLSELPQTLEVSTDARAALTYTIGTEVSMVLGGGSDFTGEYTAVTEHYGSGNSCPMTITYNIKCAQFVASGQ